MNKFIIAILFWLISYIILAIMFSLLFSIRRDYYIVFSVLESNGVISSGRTMLTTKGKITIKDIIDLEYEWGSSHELDNVLIQNIYRLKTYIDFKMFWENLRNCFFIKIKIKTKKKKEEPVKTTGPRLMR